VSVPKAILFATGNPHKLKEVGAILEPAGVRVESLGDAADRWPEPVEDRETFIGNAELKAAYYARRIGRPVLADDSGLVVDALQGAPGVRSARYSGLSGPRDRVDAANNRKLLEALRGVSETDRTARFVCAMALHDGERVLARAEGAIEGRILDAPRGSNGFGYDPLFFVVERGRTTAELDPADKNAISHRGRAARRLLEAWPTRL